jgi:hypothetical protein
MQTQKIVVLNIPQGFMYICTIAKELMHEKWHIPNVQDAKIALIYVLVDVTIIVNQKCQVKI